MSVSELERELASALSDPSRVYEIAELGSRLDKDDPLLTQTFTAKVEAVVADASSGRKTKPPGPPEPPGMVPRFDALIVSPGGVVLKGTLDGKAYLRTILGCIVEEGHWLAVLSEPEWSRSFETVRSGQIRTVCFNTHNARICFRAFHADPAAEPNTPADNVIATFWTFTAQPVNARVSARRPIPISTGRFLRTFSPDYAKPPNYWLLSTPARRYIRLPDGRDLAYRVYGPTAASPILTFCAINTSTLADPFLANAAIKAGHCLIVIQRPGLGKSSPAAHTTHASVAADACYLIRKLGLQHVTIFGSGSGASFALAAADAMGSSALRVGLLTPLMGKPSGAAPGAWAQLLAGLANNPWAIMMLARFIYAMRGPMAISGFLSRMATTCPKDTRILHDMRILDYMTAQAEDACEATMAGAVAEFRLLLSGTVYDVSRVKQPIRVWAGADNRSISIAELQARFDIAPNAQIDVIPDMGIQFGPEDADRMMAWLAGGKT